MNSRHILVDAISLGTRARALAPHRLWNVGPLKGQGQSGGMKFTGK